MDTEGRFIYELGNGQWKIARLRHLLEEVLPRQRQIKDFLVEHDFPKLGMRKMLLNARQLNMDQSGKELVLLAIQDVTKS